MISEHNKLFDISIHAPRERSDALNTSITGWENISIHAPRERSDYQLCLFRQFDHLFQSTLLVRGATVIVFLKNSYASISIHAPRERSD